MDTQEGERVESPYLQNTLPGPDGRGTVGYKARVHSKGIAGAGRAAGICLCPLHCRCWVDAQQLPGTLGNTTQEHLSPPLLVEKLKAQEY